MRRWNAKQKELSLIIGRMSGIESATVQYDEEIKRGLTQQKQKTAMVAVQTAQRPARRGAGQGDPQRRRLGLCRPRPPQHHDHRPDQRPLYGGAIGPDGVPRRRKPLCRPQAPLRARVAAKNPAAARVHSRRHRRRQCRAESRDASTASRPSSSIPSRSPSRPRRSTKESTTPVAAGRRPARRAAQRRRQSAGRAAAVHGRRRAESQTTETQVRHPERSRPRHDRRARSPA